MHKKEFGGGELKKDKNTKLRYNIVSTLIYIVGIVLLIQLFNLQIVQGEEYRETSNTRLTRESTLKAARGNLRDQSGNILAGTKSGVDVELYKTKIDTETLNTTLLQFTRILEANGDKYKDELPISINPFSFTISEQSQIEWKKSNNIEEAKTAEECFYILKEKYKIGNENIEEARKIMTLRYTIAKNGYSNTRPVQIATNISQVSVAQLNEQSALFPGLSMPVNPTRSYPSKNLASHILGYIGRVDAEDIKADEDQKYLLDDIIGRTGIEYIFEPYLKGTNGIKQIDMAVDGTVTNEYVSKEAIAGSDVILTIDANLQQVTENALEANIHKIANGGFSERSDAYAGSAVVLNVKTGEVLAMASYPDFEPELFATGITQEKYNEYNSEAAHSPLFNRAIQSTSSPGSTFKMVTAIAGLETGKITTKEKIRDVGAYKYADLTVHCWNRSGHGYLAVSDAIKHSCNYFFYETGKRVGITDLSRYAKYFGLGKKTGIELLGEEAGHVASPETSKMLNHEWYGGLTLIASIGQGDNSFSTLQMAKYTSMIANGGKDIDVTIIKSIIDAYGNEVPRQEIQEFINERLGLKEEETEKLDIKPETITAVKEGMRGVTSESGGTAYSTFRGFNIEVGGKTGSATINDQKTNAWFVGFAPFDEPEIAVVIMVENGAHGSYTAEVARDIIAEYFGMNADKVTEDMTATPTIQIQR